MKVFAAEWKKTTVTVIRASDLWNKDTLKPGDETKKNKFNRLFSELREEAIADLPEGTREARLSTLPLIDARYNEAHAELMVLLDTWVRGKNEELTESGAYNVTTGILFKDYGGGYDGPEAHAAYLIVLDEKILSYYHDTRDAYEIAILAGGYSGDWIVSNWEVEHKIVGRHGQLLGEARAWMRPSLAEIAILRPMSDYENLVRTRAGKTIESAAAWATLEAKFFQAALDVVNELAKRVYKGAPEDLMPSELKIAERLLRSRPQVLEEGQLLPLLALPCSEVNAILDSLDAILPQILDGSETAKTYNRTYTLFHTYQQLRCAVIVSDPERTDIEGRPTRYVKLTDSNMHGFQNVLDDYWETVLLWARVEKEAAQSGRSQEYQTTKATAYSEIQETVAKIQDDPWGGPLGRDPAGKIVPYAGIGIGYELYGDWIRTMAYEAYNEIKDLFTGVEVVAEPEVYIVTAGYVAALIKKYSELWRNPTYGIALQPGFLEYSVLDPSWRIFEAAVRSKIGSTYLNGIEQFEKDVETKYVEAVLAVRNKIDELRLSKADEFPTRIKEIEELVEALPYTAYTGRDASNLLIELRLLHSQVPWDSAAQVRYSAIYQALVNFIEPRGGVPKVAYPTETNAYYIDEETAFRNDTEYDKALAEWVGMDYETELTTWKNTVWAELVTLEKRTDIAEWQYPGEQEKIVRSATTTYLRWRGMLIDFAQKRLEVLVIQLHTGTATIEDRALAESGKNLIHPFVRGQVEELRIALEQMLPGAILPAALKPFALFEPLKSVSGFDVEEFSFKHLGKLIKNWAEPRIKDGIQCEPKINAYRIILEAKDGDCRIYLEGVKKDYSKIYKHLAAEVKALPTIILDGELTEEVKGKPIARAELGKYRRSAVDDTNAIVEVWDILYFEDEDLHNKPYSERREYLDKFFAGRSFKHLRKLPSWKVTSIDDLIAKAKKADAYPNSEGAMFKTSDSKYLLGRRTGDWCLAPDTPLLTPNGICDIGLIKKEDEIYGQSGIVQVKDVMRFEAKEIIRIKTMLPDLLATSEHRLLTIKNGSRKRRRIADREEKMDRRRAQGIPPRPTAGYNAEKWEAKWVEAGELRTGDYLAVVEPQWPLTKSIGKDKAYLYGWGVAEGYPNDQRQQSQFIIGLGRGAHDQIEELTEIAERYWPITMRHRHEGTKTEQHKLYVRSSGFTHWWVANFGSNSHNKKIPTWIFGLPRDERIAFLKGAILGDGAKMLHGLQYCTCSRELAYGVYNLSISLGYIPMLHLYNYTGAPYRLVWGSIIGDILPDLATKQTGTSTKRQSAHGWYRGPDGHLYIRVKSIEEESYGGPVYHIETSDETFAPLVISHNSKAKKTTDLQVMVLKVTKTKADDYVYRCGVSVKDAKGIDPKEIERRGAKEYVVLGNTFRTPIVAKPGDHLEVSITELVEQEGPQGKKYNWMLPKVKDKTTRAVDTLPYAREVGHFLSASIDLPWKFLTDKLNEAMATVSVPRLRALKAELFGVLADFNYIRLVRYAWNVVELIRERLGQAVDPLITNRGVEKIYEIGTVPRTTDRMIDEARSDYKVLTEDIQSSPRQKAKRGGELARILKGYMKTATGSLLALVEELFKEVQDFISILAKSGTQSVIDIGEKLAGIERRLDDLLREEPDTLAEDVTSLQTELKTLVKAIGESRDLFTDPIDRIFSRMEEVELPLHTSVDIRDWLRLTQMLISEAIGRIPIEAEINHAVKELQACLEEHGGRIAECMDLQEAWLEARDKLERARKDLPSTRFLLESTLPLQLTGYWDEMTDTQKTIFKEDFDRLRTVLREVKKMLEGLRGAFLWAAAKPLKLDLGCGQNKEPGGFIGIDIKPGLGINKVWNLEKGLPYPDDIADEIRAYHILEHLPEPRRTMTEIWRVLKDGGLLRFEIPSTKGEGAFADPTHKSAWCKLSFAFYTDDDLRKSHDILCKFDLISIEEEEDPETGAVYVRGILRARKTGRYAPPESVAPHFFALRGVVSKDTRPVEEGQQSASQSIAAAEEVPEEIQAEPVVEPSLADEAMNAEELTKQLLSEINWADIAFYSGTGNPRVRVSPGAERVLKPEDYENSVREEVLRQDWVPLIQEIMGKTKDKAEIAERFQRKLRIYVRNSAELARNLDAIAKERDPREYEWLGRMWYTQPPGATEEWFSTAKMKVSLAQDPAMIELTEEFGPEGANIFNKAIDKVASGLVDVSGCSGYYGGITPAGVPFFVTATHCVRKGRLPAEYVEKTLITLPNGRFAKLTPGVAYEDTQILFAENPQEAAVITKINIPLRLGAEPSGWALALGTHFNEAELLRSIGERYEGYVSIFNKAEDVYEELHRYRGGYSGGPIINSNGEVIGLSSGQYFVSPSFGDGTIRKLGDEPSPNKFAAYSSLETLKELYRVNGIPLPEYLGGARKPVERDGLYIVRRHADLIISNEKKIIIKSKELPIAERKLYLITENEILGEIELEEPEQIDEERFNELRIQHLVTNDEKDKWWEDVTKFYSYKIKSFKAFKPPKKYERKQGVQTIQKDVIPLAAAVKLTEKGEQPGNERLNWFKEKPVKIPVPGTLWCHIKGLSPGHEDLDYNAMMKLSTKDDALNLHHDVRFKALSNGLEGWTIFLGNQDDKDKLLKYEGGKLGVSLKVPQPLVWGIKKELNNRIFSPGTVGNVSSKNTFGKMFWLEDLSLLPSRMRCAPKGKRYWEFYLAFDKHSDLNGLWCISEEAAAEYDVPMMFWKMQNETPFWLRTDARHKEERESLPEWQKPTKEIIEKFLGHKFSMPAKEDGMD